MYDQNLMFTTTVTAYVCITLTLFIWSYGCLFSFETDNNLRSQLIKASIAYFSICISIYY